MGAVKQCQIEEQYNEKKCRKEIKKATAKLDIAALEHDLEIVFNKGKVNVSLSKDGEWVDIDLRRIIPDGNGGTLEIRKPITISVGAIQQWRDYLLIDALHFQSDFHVVRELL